jgi:hypothetical protein
LQLAEPKFVHVAAPWFDVVGDAGNDWAATFEQAECAKRLAPDLRPGKPSPPLGSVQTAHRLPRWLGRARSGLDSGTTLSNAPLFLISSTSD